MIEGSILFSKVDSRQILNLIKNKSSTSTSYEFHNQIKSSVDICEIDIYNQICSDYNIEEPKPFMFGAMLFYPRSEGSNLPLMLCIDIMKLSFMMKHITIIDGDAYIQSSKEVTMLILPIETNDEINFFNKISEEVRGILRYYIGSPIIPSTIEGIYYGLMSTFNKYGFYDMKFKVDIIDNTISIFGNDDKTKEFFKKIMI